MKAAIISAVVVIILASLALGYYYIFLKPQQPEVGLEFAKPAQIFVGAPFTLTVSYANYSNQILKDAILSLDLPDGVSFLGQPSDQQVLEQSVGDMGPGSVNQQSFNLIALSGAQSLKHFQAKLVYTVSTGNYSSAKFQSQAELDLSIGQSAISLTFSTPQSVFNGASFDTTVSYQNNSDQDFKYLRLKINYPPSFQFQKASMQPAENNNVWNLGSLAKGASGTFTITGSATGLANSFFSIGGTVSSDFSGQSYNLSSQTANIMIASSPLSLDMSLNNVSNYVAHLGDQLIYTFHYKNNSDIPLQNVAIKATLLGQLFDFSTIGADASFNPLNNTFTWLAANTPALTNLIPGQEGTVNLRIRVRNDFPIQRISDKNYSLKVSAEIESPTVPEGLAAQKVMSIAQMETKVAGKISVDAKAYWRDAASGILNNGPYPPKVNQSTQYTIHWKITNYGTDVSNLRITANLLGGATWTGVVKSNISSQPVYDSSSGQISWNIDHLPATTGIVTPAPEAVFQIALTPSINYLNQSITFLGTTQIQANDDFTGLTLTNSALPLDTSLPYDKTISAANRGVQQ